MNSSNKIAIFKDKKIRRIIHNNEWWFSIVDVIAAITDSSIPKRYWTDLKRQLAEKEGFVELYEKIVQLKLAADDGKKYATDCANTETLFRITQSLPSPKAEPFKRWLAQVGYERIQEIEDPELATKRIRSIYKAKGYSESWIEKRLRSIAIRDELTSEWQQRGVKEEREFSILTAEISKAAFGMTPSEYKEHKKLKRENLRDHMTDLELIFSMLGEASTVAITRSSDAKGFNRSRKAAHDGGKIAGNARIELEQKTGKKVISRDNYLNLLKEPSEK